MLEVGKALYKFFSSFGIPAYAAGSVPDDAKLPYITYTPVDATWQSTASVSASVWYGGTSYTDLFKKVDEIKKRVATDNRVPTNGGSVWIFADDPFAQQQPTDTGDNVRAMYLLFVIHCLTD